jgi:uncharacterized protein DUF4287/uncharacterized protein DUF5655
MSFQAYLDTIKEKTGKTPADFLAMAQEKGLVTEGVPAGPIIAWLAKDYGLGRGHAMALAQTFRDTTQPKQTAADRLAGRFSGERAKWRPIFDDLMAKIKAFGPAVTASATDTYISILRTGKKFAVVQVTAARMDIGVKVKGAEPTARFEPAGTWNEMVTHRLRVTDPSQIDARRWPGSSAPTRVLNGGLTGFGERQLRRQVDLAIVGEDAVLAVGAGDEPERAVRPAATGPFSGGDGRVINRRIDQVRVCAGFERHMALRLDHADRLRLGVLRQLAVRAWRPQLHDVVRVDSEMGGVGVEDRKVANRATGGIERYQPDIIDDRRAGDTQSPRQDWRLGP